MKDREPKPPPNMMAVFIDGPQMGNIVWLWHSLQPAPGIASPPAFMWAQQGRKYYYHGDYCQSLIPSPQKYELVEVIHECAVYKLYNKAEHTWSDQPPKHV